MARTTRKELFFSLVETWAQRSTCPRLRVGAVLSKGGRAIASGYNSSPAGMPHCDEVGCLKIRGREGCQRTVHAEAALISFCAKEGISLLGTTLWTTHAPCLDCAKLIINAGIQVVYYKKTFRVMEGTSLLAAAKIPCYSDEELTREPIDIVCCVTP